MKLLKIVFLISIIFACSKDKQIEDTIVKNDNGVWLIDVNDILHINSELDKIKSLDSPEFINIEDAQLLDDEIVLAIKHNNKVHVYPMSVMETHEIINDSIDDNYFAVTHCPLTASSLAWNRNINGELTTFGVSGKLFKENLIPYDRTSKSNWSQMLSLCVNGTNIGQNANHKNIVKSNFGFIKRAFPQALIVNHEECDSIACFSVHKSLKDNPVDDIVIDNIDDSERYFGIVKENSVVLFPYSNMPNTLSVQHYVVFQKRVIVILSRDFSIAQAYSIGNKIFSPVFDSLPIVMKDNNGNNYDVFGTFVSGPDEGKDLVPVLSYSAHTFAWKNIFSTITVIE